MSDLDNQLFATSKQITALLRKEDYSADNKVAVVSKKFILLKDYFGLLEEAISVLAGGRNDVYTILTEHQKNAPTAFIKLWYSIHQAFQSPIEDEERAINLLSRLVSWCYVEAFFLRTNQSPEIRSLLKLVGLELGLGAEISIYEINSAINIHAHILPELFFDRYRDTVGTGLHELEASKQIIEKRVADWESRLNAAESRADLSEAKILSYEESLEKYRVAYNFLGLSAAFKEFFGRKRTERRWLMGALAVVGTCILVWPVAAHFYVLHNSTITFEGFLDPYFWAQTGMYLSIAVIELLIVYFFRVVLSHFNSVQAQLLQLEIRLAACAFIEDYVKFANDAGNRDLSKFESLIFGGIVADVDKVPSTFDGLDQLIKIVKDLKG